MPNDEGGSVPDIETPTIDEAAAKPKSGGGPPAHHTHCYKCGASIPIFAVKCGNCDRHFLYYCPLCKPLRIIKPGDTTCPAGHSFGSSCPSPTKGKTIGGVCRRKRPPKPIKVVITTTTARLAVDYPDLGPDLTDLTSTVMGGPLTLASVTDFLKALCTLLEGHVAANKLERVRDLIRVRLPRCSMWAMEDIALILTGTDLDADMMA